MGTGPLYTTIAVLSEVGRERTKQDAKWGPQNHPDIHPSDAFAAAQKARSAKAVCEINVLQGVVNWNDVILEEVWEAAEQAALGDVAKLREELVQVAAVAVAWIEAIDRRSRLPARHGFVGARSIEPCATCGRIASDPIHTMFEPLK